MKDFVIIRKYRILWSLIRIIGKTLQEVVYLSVNQIATFDMFKERVYKWQSPAEYLQQGFCVPGAGLEPARPSLAIGF